MKRLTLILLAALALVAADPRGPVSVAPEEVGLSGDRLGAATAAIEADVAAGRVPGAVALVARHGKVAYLEARGFADREASKPMQIDTIFRIYSMTKPITSAALMTLHEEGKFMLGDPLSRYLPEFADMQALVESDRRPGDPAAGRREAARRPITVQDLMRHTAGLTYGLFSATSVDKMYAQANPLDRNSAIETLSQKLGKLPLLFHPGEKWHYSLAVDVQGRLIEVLSGQRFDRFLDERIFKPLGMVDTGFWVPADKRERFAQVYTRGRGGLTASPPASSQPFFKDGPLYSGGGGLVSTAEDYRRFAQMMLNGGELDGARILGRKTVELMTRSHTEGVDMSWMLWPGYDFGLGVAVHSDPKVSGEASSLGAYGWYGAAGTRLLIDPAEDMLLIYMVQIRGGGFRFGEMFNQNAYQAVID